MKKAHIFSLIILAIIIFSITIGIFASDNQKILISIQNDGLAYAKEENGICINTQIIDSESSKNELVVEAKVKNVRERKREVAVLLDSSYSMQYNLETMNIYTEVQKFIGGLYDNIPDLEVSVSNNEYSKQRTDNKNTAVGYVSTTNFPMGQGDDLKNGLTKSCETFSNQLDTEKYLVIFTDATDEVRQELENLKILDEINVVSILIDLTSNSYINADGTNVVGTVKEISSDGTQEINYTEIYKEIKNSITDIVFEDRFTQRTIKYFDFIPGIGYESEIEKITENNKVVGYRFKAEKIDVQEEKSIKFKLKLKSNINDLIEETDINVDDISISSKIKTTYNVEDEEFTIEKANSPVIKLVKAENIAIFAVDEYMHDARLEGIEFKVVAKDKVTGKTIINETKTTNLLGKIIFEDIATINPIEITITPNVNKEGYESTDGTQFIIEYNATSKGRTISSEEVIWNEEANRNTLNIIYPINLKKFDLEVNLSDKDNTSLTLGNVHFKLIQPKLNSQVEMDVLEGSTSGEGKILFKPAVMTKDGVYDYIISQEDSFLGYTSIGLAKVRITFKDSKVIDVEVIEKKELVSLEEKREDFVKLHIGNEGVMDKRFTLKILSKDKDQGTPIEGNMYKIYLTVDGKLSEYGPIVTNQNGELDVVLAGNGNIQFKIVEVQVNPDYIATEQEKIFEIRRTGGYLEPNFITKPLTVKGNIYPENNIVEVELESTLKKSQNVLRFNVVDIMEDDIKISNLRVDVIREYDGRVFGGKTDLNGNVNVILPKENEGEYNYTIRLSNIPVGYLPANTGSIKLTYTKDGIIDKNLIANSNQLPFLSIKALDENNNTTKSVGADIKLGLDIDVEENYAFTVKLLAGDSKEERGIEGARYNITITTILESGETIERVITNRKTDYDGEIHTRLVLGPKINIEVQEVYTNIGIDENGNKVGFILDDVVQEIELEYNGEEIKVVSEGPHNNAEGLGMGTTIDENQVIYIHKNFPRTVSDTFLNVHIIKQDKLGAYIQGLGLLIYTEDEIEVNGDGEDKVLINLENGMPLSDENPIFAITDENGEVDLLRLIKVSGIVQDPTLIQSYTFTVVECDPITKDPIPESIVKYQIDYRFNEYTSQIEFVNTDIIIGKKKERERTKFSSYTTVYGFESRVELTLYPHYGNVGNFILDLQKYDNENNQLTGAEYDITVTRPDGSVLNYKNKKVTNEIELNGFYVTKDTVITIKEVVAPIGFEVNQLFDEIEIKDLAEDGTLIYEVKKANYEKPRTEIISQSTIEEYDGTVKNSLRLKLIDMKKDTFKFGILAKDKETDKPVQGYSFKIVNSKYAEKKTNATDEKGEVSTLIGGNYKGEGPITYTISTNTPAQYYKDLIQKIKLQLYFNEEGKIDTERTLQNQIDADYGITWKIRNTNNIDGNDIDIEILVEPFEKLIVELQTVDKSTGDTITDITYNIPESININATGTTKLEVGYVEPGKTKIYTLNVMNLKPEYVQLENQQFSVEFDSTTGDIVDTPNMLGDSLVYLAHKGKTVKIKVILEPKTKFTVELETVDTLTHNVLTHIKYKIPESQDIKAEGMTELEVGYLKMDTTNNIFTINTVDLGPDYVEPNNQQFRVDIEDITGNITNPIALGSDLEIISYTDKSVKIRVNLQPKIIFTVEIESVDIISGQKVSGIVYEIPESQNIKSRGTSSLDVGYVFIDTLANPETYTIHTADANNASIEYVVLDDQQIKIGIDANGDIGSYEILTSKLEYISHSGRKIKLRLKVEPKMVFVVQNKAHTTNIPLQGGIFEIENLDSNEVSSNTTSSDGNAIIYNGTYYQDRTIIYKVKQKAAKIKYARVEDFYVAVSYNANREITKAVLCDENGNTISNSNNLWVNVSHSVVGPGALGYNGNGNGIVIIEVLSYPELIMNFEVVDRRDNSIKLKEAKYNITSNSNAIGIINTDENGRDTAYIDGVYVSKNEYYTVQEIKSSAKYQSIEDFFIKIHYDSYGFIDSVNLVEEPNDLAAVISKNYITVTTIQNRVTIADQLTVNVKIEVNPRLTMIVNKTGTKGNPVNGVEITISNKEVGTEDVLSSATGIKTGYLWNEDLQRLVLGDTPGYTRIELEKTLTNKRMEFEVTEKENPLGYKKLTEEIKFEADFDNDGKIIESSINVTSGSKYIRFTNIYRDDFIIEMQFINEEIEEFGIRLIAQDTYDEDKKLENTEGLEIDMISFYNDSKVGLRDRSIEGKLIPGRDSDSDGTPDVGHGEDYQKFGKVVVKYDWVDNEFDNGKRTIRLSLKNAPNRYYKEDQFADSYYQKISKMIELEVIFDREGKIQDAKYKTGKINGVWYIDNRYIEIDYSGYDLTVKLKFFPTLQIGINAIDEYTKQNLEGASYYLSTIELDDKFNTTESRTNKAGYIGDDFTKYHKYPTYMTETTTVTTQANRVSVGPTEIFSNAINLKNGVPIRRIFIYENKEPSTPIQYQQYEPRYNADNKYLERKLLGYIDVFYNELGEIKYSDVIISPGNSKDNNNTPDGTYYIKVSQNQYDSKHAIALDIEYKPTTRLKLYVVDEVTKAGLGGVKVYPFKNNTITTNRNYNYRTIEYQSTSSTGLADVTYWGGNLSNSQNTYIIDTQFVGATYSEYYNPERVSIDVEYDANGRIKSATSTTKDTFGDDNAQIVKFYDNTVEVYILCYRRLNIRFNKLDEYDHVKILDATFKLEDEKGTETIFDANKLLYLGKFETGKTKQFKISEITEPEGYIPVDDFTITLKFNADGTITATADSTQFEQIQIRPASMRVSEKPHIDTVLNIYDKPSFKMQVVLTDEYYSNIKIAGGTFTIINNKGDSVQKTTDVNGFFETYVGPAYPGETVKYTISQNNTVPTYNQNLNVATLTVEFGTNGKVMSYGFDQPVPYNYYVHNTKYINQKNIMVEITNMPKDVLFGIMKYDELTNEPLSGIEFNVNAEVESNSLGNTSLITNEDGCKIEVVDSFAKRAEPSCVRYTISEISVPNTYRKMQDVVIDVTYNEDGRIGRYTVVSNPSKVQIEVAIASQIKYINGNKVHFALTIPNNNSYDLIIKDEDQNFEGLGIEGTSYNVSINGITQTNKTTDKNGIIEYLKRTENGTIEINISENTIGEGYRTKSENNIIFSINKGTTVYSLELDEVSLTSRGYIINDTIINSVTGEKKYDVTIDQLSGTKAIISVNEVTGQIKVIFQNETKLELKLTKNDINTGRLLQGAEFEIASQVIYPIEEEEEIITTVGINNITDENGGLYFDLGTAPQSKIVRYTFKEITPPLKEDGTPYGKINDIELEVKFDMYGRINPQTSLKDNSPRCEAYMPSSTGNSRDIRVIIGNGALKKSFTLKIISEDSITGERINDSIFRVDGVEINTGFEALKDQIVKTITDTDTNGIVKQEGIYINKNVGTQNKDDILITIQQEECAEGYIFGNNVISGTIIINKQNIEGDELEAPIELTLGTITGFDSKDVVLDTLNNELIVTIKNDPNTSLELHKFYEELRTYEIKPLENAEFTLKMEVDGNVKLTKTNLLTDSNGNIKFDLGIPEYNKMVTYTIVETPINGFEELKDIIINVQYDIKGKILNYTIVSNDEYTEIKDRRTIEKNSYQINLSGEKEIIDTKSVVLATIGGRTLPVEVENVKIAESENYKVIVEKYGPAKELIQGAKYEITVSQEYGGEYTWDAETDEDGKITSKEFEGYGEITVKVTEKIAPAGYVLDSETKILKFARDKKLGDLIYRDSNVNYEFSKDFKEIYIRPVDELKQLSMYLYKVNAETRERIENNSASFELYLEESNDLVKVGEGHTNKNGELIITNIKEPVAAGKYNYYLRETVAPDGYLIPDVDIKIEIEFIIGNNGELIIDNVNPENYEYISGLKHGSKHIMLNLLNKPDLDTPEQSFNIIIEKHTNVPGDDSLLEGAGYEIKVYGEDNTPIILNEITNEEGKIETEKFHEFGKVRVEITETQQPAGYLLDTETKYVEFKKLKGTGLLEGRDSNVEYDISEDGKSSIIIKPKDEIANYAIYLNKVDKDTNYRIDKNPATFELYELVDDEKVLVDTKVTDMDGQLKIDQLVFPAEEGETTYYLREIISPTGYYENTEDMEIKVLFRKNDEGNFYIAGASGVGENIVVVLKADKYIKLNVKNKRIPDNSDFNIILEKHTTIEGDDNLIPGAEYHFKITYESGIAEEWNDITNEDGVIVSDIFKGEGRIRLDIVEEKAPKGFKKDENNYYIEFVKNRETGELSKAGGNIEFEFSEDGKSSILLKNYDDFEAGKYVLYVNKINKRTKKNVENNPAVFELYMENEDETRRKIKTFTTNSLGTAIIFDETMSTNPGKYKYILKETVAPVDYALETDELKYEVEYDLDDNNEMYIKNITAIDDKLKIKTYGNQYIIMDFENKEIKDLLGNYAVEITKIDSETKEPILNKPEEVTDVTIDDMTAIFKLTDSLGNVYYKESDREGKIVFDELVKPTAITGSENYVEEIITIKEIMAPCGYKLAKGETQFKIRFIEDMEYGVIVDTSYLFVEYGNDNIEESETIIEDDTVKLSFKNKEGNENDIEEINRGSYNLILTKVEKETKELLPKEAEFNIALENGQRIQSSVKNNAKIEVLEIRAPIVAGEYEYVIEETEAPDGYLLNNELQILKVQFEDDPNDISKLIITNAVAVTNQAGETALDVTSFANNTVEVDFENEPDDTLYLQSKHNEQDEDIYNVFQEDDLPYVSFDNAAAQKLGKTYTFNKPTIYTKEILKYASKKLGISIEEFVKNLDTNAEKLTVYNSDGKEAATVDMDGKGNILSINLVKTGKTDVLIKTGQTIKAERGTQELIYDVIIKGDLNGDGMLTTADSTKMKQILATSTNFGDMEKAAGDVDTQGLVTTADSTLIKQIIAGIK